MVSGLADSSISESLGEFNTLCIRKHHLVSWVIIVGSILIFYKGCLLWMRGWFAGQVSEGCGVEFCVYRLLGHCPF